MSDIQDYFEYNFKKYGAVADNLYLRIYLNEIENRITFKIETGYYLKILTTEKMKWLGSNKSKITKAKNGENMRHLEINKVILIHCNTVNNDYRQNPRALYTFVPDKHLVNY